MKRLLLIPTLIAAQILVALAAGYIALDSATPAQAFRGAAAHAFYGASAHAYTDDSDLDLSGLGADRLAALVERASENEIQNGMAVFTYGDTEFIFRYSEIGLRADYSTVKPNLLKKSANFYINNLLTAFNRDYGGAPQPIFSLDAGAFRQKLYQMMGFINKPPVSADVNYSAEGVITRTYAEYGVLLDVVGSEKAIAELYLSDPLKPFAMDSKAMVSSKALIIVAPPVSDDKLADINTILAEISVPITDGLDMYEVWLVAEAVNKVWAPKKSMADAPISFRRYLTEAGLDAATPSPEHELVASALLHALLISGVDYSVADYTKSSGDAYPALAGFNVDLSADFLVTNSLDSNIVIFASVSGGALHISIAGNSAQKGQNAAPHDVYTRAGNSGVDLIKDDKVIG